MNNVVEAKAFWTSKVNKIIQNFDYGKITIEELVDQMCNMGYDRKQVWNTSNIKDVDEVRINNFFESLGDRDLILTK